VALTCEQREAMSGGSRGQSDGSGAVQGGPSSPEAGGRPSEGSGEQGGSPWAVWVGVDFFLDI
jgi:hypothetical protein